MTAADGKQRMTDVADTEQLLRLILTGSPSEKTPARSPTMNTPFHRSLTTLATALMLALTQASADYADSSNVTVDTRTLTMTQWVVTEVDDPDMDGLSTYDVVVSGVLGAPPQQTYTDTGRATGNRMFYRVELEP